jgi:hypothetical protein
VGKGIGVVPSVSKELLNGVSRGYVALQAAVELLERGQRALVMPTAEQTLTKGALPQSFDAGERETAVLAKSRGEKIRTNEQLVKNWCEREAGTYLDLPGILKSL